METLNSDLRKTPKELKIDLIGYQLAQGEVEKAWKIAEKMDDNSIIEKLCCMRKSGSVSNVQESELESYRNIRSLKESTDQNDIFHIYKMNCEEINNEPNYVFKTSCKCLEMVLKMDCGEETVGSKAV